MAEGCFILEDKMSYPIDAQRIKTQADKRGWTIYKIAKSISIDLRSLRRNLAKGNMQGKTIVEVSRLLDCTPYYFLNPSPLDNWLMTDGEPLGFWNYEIQTLDIAKTRRDFLIIRGLDPHLYAQLDQKDIEELETMIIKYVGRIEKKKAKKK